MRILDENQNTALTSVLILLTPSEFQELVDKLRKMEPSNGDHIHLSNDKFTKEITIAVYTPDNMHFFSKRIRKLLEIDE